MVAGAGFEPTTSGLSLRAALRCPKKSSSLRSSEHNPESADAKLSRCNKKEQPTDGGLFFLVAGAGFEPTTSGL